MASQAVQPVRELALASRSPWSDKEVRGYAIALVALEAVLGLFIAALVVGGSVHYEGLVVGIWIIVAGLVLWWAWPRVRQIWARSPRLLVSESEISIDAPGVLKAPIVVPRRDVRAVCLDTSGEGGFGEAGIVARFPIYRSESPWRPPVPTELVGYLYSSDRGSVVPQLGRQDVRPNVAVLFHRPLGLPRVKRMSRVAFVGYPPHGPADDGTPIPGLLLQIADTAAAREMLEDLVVSGLTEYDVHKVAPGAPLVRAVRRKVAWIKVGLAAVVGYRVLIVLHLLHMH